MYSVRKQTFGIAFVKGNDVKVNGMYTIPNNTYVDSISKAEKLAIIKNVKFIISNNIVQSVIFTDSLSTLQGLLNESGSELESSVYSELEECLLDAQEKGCNIKLCYVPAHVGVEGNCHVDALAKVAAKTGARR